MIHEYVIGVETFLSLRVPLDETHTSLYRFASLKKYKQTKVGLVSDTRKLGPTCLLTWEKVNDL